MNIKYGIFLAIGLAVFSCKKNESEPATETTEHSHEGHNHAEHAEESMVQDAKILKNSNGETISITYFAQGDQVAVKLKKGNEEERTLSAKGTSKNGNPVFTDGTYAWEISDNGQGGILIDSDNKSESYH